MSPTGKKPSGSAPARPPKKRIILVVDDDDFLSRIIRDKLHEAGYATLSAKDGAAGLKTARAKKPAAILLDVLLPKLDGFRVLEELKKSPETSRIPVLMLTNLGKREDVDKALKLGAAEYLIKAHFAPPDMIERINRLVGRNRSSKQFSRELADELSRPARYSHATHERRCRFTTT
jgi:DNA-binding response OmpR family regulator